eukprot:6468546-Amphidinium_carterae.2
MSALYKWKRWLMWKDGEVRMRWWMLKAVVVARHLVVISSLEDGLAVICLPRGGAWSMVRSVGRRSHGRWRAGRGFSMTARAVAHQLHGGNCGWIVVVKGYTQVISKRKVEYCCKVSGGLLESAIREGGESESTGRRRQELTHRKKRDRQVKGEDQRRDIIDLPQALCGVY